MLSTNTIHSVVIKGSPLHPTRPDVGNTASARHSHTQSGTRKTQLKHGPSRDRGNTMRSARDPHTGRMTSPWTSERSRTRLKQPHNHPVVKSTRRHIDQKSYTTELHLHRSFETRWDHLQSADTFRSAHPPWMAVCVDS